MKYVYLIKANDYSLLEEKELNELGEKGWELIQILKESRTAMTESYRDYTIEEYHHIFKKVLDVE
ncbi:DUF4177 domain-containing protein [Candidatus Poribacteria bacterium]|nr:DUF4177 domain-containing protein [Candidatus Poribacteria bacterium]